jgi:multidrug efflux system membrane fusion protein
VVHVAAAVAGRIIEIRVRENSPVHRGEVLFQIDPLPYQLQVSQAQADLALAEAQLDTQRRYVSTQRSSATVAHEQTTSAKADFKLATRTAERLRPLTSKGYVTSQQLDQADSLQRRIRRPRTGSVHPHQCGRVVRVREPARNRSGSGSQRRVRHGLLDD